MPVHVHNVQLWGSFLASSTMQEGTKLHDCAQNFKKISGVYPRIPNVGGGDSSMHPCLGQSPHWHFSGNRLVSPTHPEDFYSPMSGCLLSRLLDVVRFSLRKVFRVTFRIFWVFFQL